MSEPVRNPGKDDFIPAMNDTANLYKAALAVGLPEPRAWELAHDTYMMLLAATLSSTPREDPDDQISL